MGLVVRMVAASAVAVGLLMAAQLLWVSASAVRVATQSQSPQMAPIPGLDRVPELDSQKLRQLAAPSVTPLDMSAARRGAAEGELHRLDLTNPGRSAFSR
jgi:hypothetical protein